MKRIAAAVLLSSSAAVATTILKLDLAEVVQRSDRAFLATVVATCPEWCEAESRAYTIVTFRVERDLADPLPAREVSLRFLGGTATRGNGNVVRQVVHGMPEFQVGERVVVFSLDDARLYCPVVGWNQGCYRVRLDPDTGDDRVYDCDGLPVTSLSTRDVKVSATGQAVTLAAFLERVAELRALPCEEGSMPPVWIERSGPCTSEVVLPVGGGQRTRPNPEAPAWPLGLAAVMVALGVLLGIRRR